MAIEQVVLVLRMIAASLIVHITHKGSQDPPRLVGFPGASVQIL